MRPREEGSYGVKAFFNSSLPQAREIRVLASHSYEEGGNARRGEMRVDSTVWAKRTSVYIYYCLLLLLLSLLLLLTMYNFLFCQLALKWNEMKHSVFLDARTHSAGVMEARLKTESTNPVADDILVRFRRETSTASRWRSENYLKVGYQEMELLMASLKLDTLLSATASARTPFSRMRSLRASYDVRNEARMEAEFDHNGRQNWAELRASLENGGGVRSVKVEADHSFGPNLAGEASLEDTAARRSGRLAASFGDYGVELSAEREAGGDFEVAAKKISPVTPADFKVALRRTALENLLESWLNYDDSEVFSLRLEKGRGGASSGSSARLAVLSHQVSLSGLHSSGRTAYNGTYLRAGILQSEASVSVSSPGRDTIVEAVLKTTDAAKPHLRVSSSVRSVAGGGRRFSGQIETAADHLRVEGDYRQDARADRSEFFAAGKVESSLEVISRAEMEARLTVPAGGQGGENGSSASIVANYKGDDLEVNWRKGRTAEGRELRTLDTAGSLLPQWLRVHAEREAAQRLETYKIVQEGGATHTVVVSRMQCAAGGFGCSRMELKVDSNVVPRLCPACSERLDMDLETAPFHGKLDMSSPPGRLILGAEVEIDPASRREAAARLSLPVFGLPPLKAEARMTGQMPLAGVLFKVTRLDNNQEVYIFAKITDYEWTPERTGLGFESQVNTPFEGWEEMRAKFEAEKTEEKWMADFDLRRAEEQFKVEATLNLGDKTKKAALSVESDLFPIFGEEKLEVMAEVDLEKSELHGECSLGESLGATLVGSSRYIPSSQRVEADLVVSSRTGGPRRWQEAVSKIRGSYSRRNDFSMDFYLESDLLNVESVVGLSDGSVKVRGRIPLIEEDVDLVVDYKVMPLWGKVTVDNHRQRTYELEWKRAGEGKRFEASAKTPIDGLGSAGLVLEVEPDNTYVASFTHDGGMYGASGRWASAALEKEASLSLVADTDAYASNVDLKLLLKQQQNPWAPALPAEAKAQMAYNGNAFTIEERSEGHLSSARIELNLPDLDLPQWSASAKLDIEARSLGVKAVVSGATVLSVALADGEASAKVDTLWTGTHEATVKWSKHHGTGSILVQSHGARIVEGSVQWDLKHFTERGHLALTGATTAAWFSHTANVEASYDVAGREKTAYVQLDLDDLAADFALDFQLTRDEFDGVAKVQSNHPALDDIEVRASYVIKAEPEASLTVKRGSSENTIGVRVNLEGVIPTVSLTTTFRGFENVVFRGNYHTTEDSSLFDFHITINDRKLVYMANKVVLGDSTFKLLSSLSVLMGKDINMGLKTQVRWEDPYMLEVSYQDSADIYRLKGDLSVNEQKFAFSLDTPIEGLESVLLVGKTGTTSVGSSLGFSFGGEGGRQRRHLGFEYERGDEGGTIGLRTPFEGLRSLKLRRAKRQVELTQEDESGLVARLTVNYDFDCSDGIVSVSGYSDIPSWSRRPTFNIRLERQDDGPEKRGFLQVSLDVDESHKLDAKVELKKLADPCALKLSASVDTPMIGGKYEVDATLGASTSVLASYPLWRMPQQEIRFTCEVKEEEKTLRMTLDTPYSVANLGRLSGVPAYQEIDLKDLVFEATYGEDDGAHSVDSVLLLGSHRLAEMDAVLEVNAVGAGSLQWKLSLPQYENQVEIAAEIRQWRKGHLEVKTTYDVSTIQFGWDIRQEGDRTTATYQYEVAFSDGFYVRQTSTTVVNPDSIKNHAVNSVNLPGQSAVQVFDYEIEKDPATGWPTAVRYVVTQDDVRMVELSASVEKKSDGFEAPFKVEIPAAGASYEGSLTLATDWEKAARLEFASNMPGASSVVLKGSRVRRDAVDEDEHSYDLEVLASLEVNGEQLAKAAAALKGGPVWYKCLLQVSSKRPAFRQKMEYKWKPELSNSNSEFRSVATLMAKGDLLDLTYTESMDLKMGEKMLCRYTLQGTPKFRCSLMGRSNCEEFKYGLTVGYDIDKREAKILLEKPLENVKHEFLVSAQTGDGPGRVDVGVTFESTEPHLPTAAVRLSWNVASATKQLSAALQAGAFLDFSLAATADWTPRDSDIVIRCKVQEAEVNFLGKREDFVKSASYRLTGKHPRMQAPVTLFSFVSNNDIRSLDDFRVEASMSSPAISGHHYLEVSPELSLEVTNRADADHLVRLDASLKYDFMEAVLTTRAKRSEFDVSSKFEFWNVEVNDAAPFLRAEVVLAEDGEKETLSVTAGREEHANSDEWTFTLSCNGRHWRDNKGNPLTVSGDVSTPFNEYGASVLLNLPERTLEVTVEEKGGWTTTASAVIRSTPEGGMQLTARLEGPFVPEEQVLVITRKGTRHRLEYKNGEDILFEAEVLFIDSGSFYGDKQLELKVDVTRHTWEERKYGMHFKTSREFGGSKAEVLFSFGFPTNRNFSFEATKVTRTVTVETRSTLSEPWSARLVGESESDTEIAATLDLELPHRDAVKFSFNGKSTDNVDLKSEFWVGQEKESDLVLNADLSKKALTINVKAKEFFFRAFTTLKEANAVSLEITSSLDIFADVKLEGSWVEEPVVIPGSEEVGSITVAAAGNVNSEEVRFNGRLLRVILPDGKSLEWTWTASKGTEEVSSTSSIEAKDALFQYESSLTVNGKKTSTILRASLQGAGKCDVLLSFEMPDAQSGRIEITGNIEQGIDVRGKALLERDDAYDLVFDVALRLTRSEALLEVNLPSVDLHGKAELAYWFRRLSDFNLGAGLFFGRRGMRTGFEYGVVNRRRTHRVREFGIRASLGRRMDWHFVEFKHRSERNYEAATKVATEAVSELTFRGSTLSSRARVEVPKYGIPGEPRLTMEVTHGVPAIGLLEKYLVLEAAVQGHRGSQPTVRFNARLPSHHQTLQGTFTADMSNKRVEGEATFVAWHGNPLKMDVVLDLAISQLNVTASYQGSFFRVRRDAGGGLGVRVSSAQHGGEVELNLDGEARGEAGFFLRTKHGEHRFAYHSREGGDFHGLEVESPVLRQRRAALQWDSGPQPRLLVALGGEEDHETYLLDARMTSRGGSHRVSVAARSPHEGLEDVRATFGLAREPGRRSVGASFRGGDGEERRAGLSLTGDEEEDSLRLDLPFEEVTSLHARRRRQAGEEEFLFEAEGANNLFALGLRRSANTYDSTVPHSSKIMSQLFFFQFGALILKVQ